MITTDPTVQATATRGQVQNALRESSDRTGTNFSYLLRVAQRESHLSATAQAPNSSASGVFQFNEQTWLHMVKAYGSQYGLGAEAKEISTGAGGRQEVSDPAERQAILAERNDPKLSALMAGQLASENRNFLSKRLGRPVSDGEVYAAHIFGASGALKLIRTADDTPDATAADVLPTAARANRNLFYGRGGGHQARSAEQVMSQLQRGAGSTLASTAAGSPATATPAVTGNMVLADDGFDDRPTPSGVPMPRSRPADMLSPDSATLLAGFAS
jgi:hypothetical protein